MPASPTWDGSNSDYTGVTVASMAITAGTSISAGDLIWVYFNWGDSATDFTVADSLGNTAYQNTSAKVGPDSNFQFSKMMYIISAFSGTPVVTVTPTGGTAAFCTMRAGGATGINATPLDQGTGQAQASPGTGTDAVTSGSVTTTTNGQFVVACTVNSTEASPGAGTISPGTGFTTLTSNPLPGIHRGEYMIQGGAGSVAGTFTHDVNTVQITTVATFKAAGGGGSAPPEYQEWNAGPIAPPPGLSDPFVTVFC